MKNKNFVHIQLVVFKPIPTARKYYRDNESMEEDNNHIFLRETETTKSRFKKKLTLISTVNEYLLLQ
jgi:hypothetical protein